MGKVVWMFSGQGSQYYEMGRDLFDADSGFRDSLHACDRHYARLTGQSIAQIIYPLRKKPESEPFDDILQTHPALFCIQYALAQTLLRRGMKPDLVLGYSLGEWVALAVAGGLPFPAVIESLLQQADLLKNGTPPGAMLAVMASRDILTTSPVFLDVNIAAFNFPNHFVLSGARESIEAVQQVVRAEGVTHQRLPVHVAFHSPLVDGIADAYSRHTSQLRPRPLTFPLVSLSHSNTFETLPDNFFWNVLRRPVHFEDNIRRLQDNGEFRFVDLGPSGTLATFLKYVLKPGSGSTFHPILTAFRQAVDNLEQLENAL